MNIKPWSGSTWVVQIASNKGQSTFFCCSLRNKSTMLFGAKQPCQAHAIMTIPEMSHALEKSNAFLIALKLFPHGAFCANLMSPVTKIISWYLFDTHCDAFRCSLEKRFIVSILCGHPDIF